YIIASRAYSYRGIRLKKFPVTGFLTVIVFQGAVTYFMVYAGSSALPGLPVPWQGMLISSLLFGGFYPLTQIYQHQQDLRDGVRTISWLLGYKGTFVFSGTMFLLAEVLLFFYFSSRGQDVYFWLLQLFFLPAIAYFFFWFGKVRRDSSHASFHYAMRMNLVGALCTNAGFILLFYLQHLHHLLLLR
ncbi:MAG TPA: prenyltransferase, partial [Anseongella sp.]|nr:prenyltransferase [Anseongella sp.]